MGFVAAAGIGAVASIGGAELQSSAATHAANVQAGQEAQATAEQQAMYNQNQQNIQPFIQQGTAAANQVSALEGLNGGTPSTIMNTLEQLPGYQFANTQGLKSVQNANAARGLGVSGAALKGAAAYSTGLANTQYNNYLTGIQNTENTGANAAGGLASVGAQTGANIAGTIVGQGNALAQGTVNSAGALAGGLTGGANSLQNAFYTNQILGGLSKNNNGYNDPNLISYTGQNTNDLYPQQI
jgi:hypothetical protein